MMSVSGLDDHEAADVAAEFGVALEQVRRDHLISVILSALSAHAEELVFFGGTARARSYLPHGRLSEDIDLIAMGDRPDIAVRLVRTIGRVLRRTTARSHGALHWPTFVTPRRSFSRPTTPSTFGCNC
jgi:predicted nucleotidyltransferase component of viral defense system